MDILMNALKDALMKAGFKETAKPAKPTTPKDENFRPEVKVKGKDKVEVKQTITHQKQRNYCEECSQIKPDVEYYQHNNPTTEAEWICLRCADRLKIFDNCRRTAQSDTAIKKLFRREHGATTPFQAFQQKK